MATTVLTSVYANGHDLGGALKSISVAADVEVLDSTTLANTYRVPVPGFKGGKFSASGVFANDGTNLDEIHNILAAAFTAGTNITITSTLGAAAVIGGDAVMLDSYATKYAVNVPLGQLIMVELDAEATNGIGWGKWLFNASVASTTTNGASVNNGAATTNGGFFHAHLQNSTLSDVPTKATIKLQHATDDATWVDLIAASVFSDVGGLPDTFGVLTSNVAAGTTVRQYLRASVTTDSGTATVQAAFARR